MRTLLRHTQQTSSSPCQKPKPLLTRRQTRGHAKGNHQTKKQVFQEAQKRRKKPSKVCLRLGHVSRKTFFVFISSFRSEASAGQVTPNPADKRREQRNDPSTPELLLGTSSPATPQTLKSWSLTPQKASLLSKHGRKVKNLVPLTLAASKEVVAIGREPTNEDFGQILVWNVERMVLLFNKVNG